jgi:fatty acid desaturase
MERLPPQPASGLWRNSPRDGWLVLFSLVEASLKVAVILTFERLSPAACLLLGVVLTYLNCMNYEVTGHYFLHTPFFRSPALNAGFGLLNSLAFGFPQTWYRAEHVNHHQFNCDRRHPVTGRTRDGSSIYRYGPGGDEHEPLWRYTLVGPFREDLRGYWRATPRRLRPQLALETAGVLALFGLAALSGWGPFLFLVTILWTGSAASHLQSWLEHAHARPESRLTDSVSSYGRLYNRLWFNNGYHQEHHYRPTCHWSRLPELRADMLPETERRVVRHAHLWNVRR